MHKHRILILGGSGFIGQKLYKELSPFIDTYATFCHHQEFENNHRYFSFDVSEDEAMQSVAEVADMPRTTYDDAELLKAINEAYSPAQKTALVESLWEIALADGELHRFENHAILAIANKLGMGQAELDATRAAAKARLAA